MALNNNQIYKGSKLMVFLGDSSAAPIAFATNHNLSITVNTSEVSTKDHGDFPSVIAKNMTWEITTENLYSAEGQSALWTAMKKMQPVTVAFADTDYSNTTTQKGLQDLSDDGPASWTQGASIASGKALITSLQVNAPAGDNATLSATFTGVGSLDQAEPAGPTGQA